MHVQKEKITPAIAMAYLNANTSNRPLSQARVNALVSAMQRGEWKFNGDVIRFSDTGVLLDGQHRLSAIVKSGLSQDMLVVRGLSDETFTTIDTGKSRSSKDVLALAGFANTSVIAASVRLYLLWKKNGKPFEFGAADKITNDQVLKFCEQNQVVHNAGSYVGSNKFLRRFGTPSFVGFVYLAISEENEELAVAFFDEVSGRSEINPSSAAFLLREKMLEMHSAKSRWTPATKIAYMMKAFRIWRTGRKAKILKVAMAGKQAEKEIFSIGPINE